MIMLLTRDDTVNLSKFISREQLSPLRLINWCTTGLSIRCIHT